MTNRSTITVLFLGALCTASNCKDKDNGSGLVADAAPVGVVDAGTAPVGVADINQCVGCATPAPLAWTFEGIYRDAACTEPLAQVTAGVCVQIPALGPTTLTFVDDVGSRKAGETAQVTLTDQIEPTAVRYRKAGTKCVKANEGATNLAPANCGGLRVCRDATGALSCQAGGCRNLQTGCPDFEESRLYAAINDPNLKKPTGGGGGNLAACCNALVAEAKRLGSSPEAGVIMGAAAQCQVLAAQVGPNGTAPELSAVRAALKGRPLPPACQGL